jgi:outer membrane protein assembly factor BamB
MKNKKVILISISAVIFVVAIAATVALMWFYGFKRLKHGNSTDEFMTAEFHKNLVITENSQWRGERRDGVYNETELQKAWHKDGPELLWAFEGLGDGFTSPAIANERLYLTGLIYDELFLYVFDLCGKLLAKKHIDKERIAAYPGPRSTICVNDGKLYLYTAFGMLHCLNETTLETVWTKSLFSDFDGKDIMWGVNESPLIVGEKIFMTPGGVKHNVVALNKHTGELIWSSPGMGTPSSYCSPQFIEGYAVPMMVTNTLEHIIALNANTGEMLWAHPQTNQQNIHPNTPLYSDGMILSTTGYGGGTVMLRLINDGKTVKEVWKNSEMDCQMGGIVKVGNYVYATGHKNKNWFCVDWNTGKTMYKDRSLAGSNVIYADGMLYLYSDRGKMHLVKPNPDQLELVSSFDVTLGTDQHWAHPVIHSGVLYIRHGNALMAYKIKA